MSSVRLITLMLTLAYCLALLSKFTRDIVSFLRCRKCDIKSRRYRRTGAFKSHVWTRRLSKKSTESRKSIVAAAKIAYVRQLLTTSFAGSGFYLYRAVTCFPLISILLSALCRAFFINLVCTPPPPLKKRDHVF